MLPRTHSMDAQDTYMHHDNAYSPQSFSCDTFNLYFLKELHTGALSELFLSSLSSPLTNSLFHTTNKHEKHSHSYKHTHTSLAKTTFSSLPSRSHLLLHIHQ